MSDIKDMQNLELAPISSRLKAFVIDDLLITLIVFVLLWESIDSSDGDLVTVLTIMNQNIWQVIIIKFLYQTFFVWYYGATLGKTFAKIRVIDFNNLGRVSLLDSALRSVLRIVSEMFFYLGFIFAYFNEPKQTFHDKLAKTLVVNA